MEILFLGTFFWLPIRSIIMKITLDMGLCEKTLTNIAPYKN